MLASAVVAGTKKRKTARSKDTAVGSPVGVGCDVSGLLQEDPSSDQSAGGAAASMSGGMFDFNMADNDCYVEDDY